MRSDALLLQGGGLRVFASPLEGFEWSTWAVIVVNGLGGLLVAVVIKYADNIWKGFATAGAVVLTGALAPLLGLGPPPTWQPAQSSRVWGALTCAALSGA